MKYLRRPITLLTSILLLTISQVQAQYTVLSDDFEGTTVDDAIWTATGWYAPNHDVSDSSLDLWIAGHSHQALVYSVRDDLDFFNYDLTITIDLDPEVSLQPTPDLTADDAEYVLGIMSIVGDSTYSSWSEAGYPGLDFNLRWDKGEDGSVLTLAGEAVSGVPERIVVEANATSIQLTITGATFTTDGSSQLVRDHGLSPADFPHFQLILGVTPRLFDYEGHLKVDNVTVESDTEILVEQPEPTEPIIPGIVPFNDPDWPAQDAGARAAWERILMSKPDLEERIPNAVDYGRIVYIDPSAATNGTGESPEDPLNSWTEVSFEENTAYLQKCGTSETLTRRLLPVSGVLLGAYGEGSRPFMNCVQVMGGDRAAIEAATDNVIRDLHITATDLAACIKLGHQYTTVYNCDLENAVWGLRGYGSGYTILQNSIHGQGDDGIFLVDATSPEIGWNYIFNINTDWEEPYTSQDIASGDSIQFESASDWHVHHNVLDRTNSGNKFCLISNNGKGECIAEYNRMFGPLSTGDGGSAIYFGSHDADGHVEVRYNSVERAPSAMYHHVANASIYGNTFWKSGGLYNVGGNPLVCNNVFYRLTGTTLVSGQAVLRNNIFDNRRTLGLSGSVMENNLFMGNAMGDSSNLSGDPMFVDPEQGDFHLMPGSPAIDAGINVGIVTDREGVIIPRMAAPDMGAFEYRKEWIETWSTYPPSQWRWTPVGMVDDTFYPWVYVAALNEEGEPVVRWVYIMDRPDMSGGFYMWDSVDGFWSWIIVMDSVAWIWTLNDHPGWSLWGQ